jgi:hypothetical protein
MRTAIDVTAAVSSMARVFDKAIEGETIAFFAKVLLGRLTADEACEAIAVWCARHPRWPAPAQLIELVYPQTEARDGAAELAMRLRATIARRGYTWEQTCRYDGHASIEAAIEAEVGLDALAVVRRCGGWAAFCREWGGDEGDTSSRAQLRGLCEAVSKNAGLLPALSAPRTTARVDGPQHIGAILGGKIDPPVS